MRATVVVVVVVALLWLSACKTTSSRTLSARVARPLAVPAATGTEPPAEIQVPVELVRTPTTIDFVVDDAPVHLGALLTAARHDRGPGIVIVPGASDISKEGIRKSDGVVMYATPLATGDAWSTKLAERGAVVLTYDKRTCGPNYVATCHKNPQSDIDAEGPAALAKDVDAACGVIKAAPGFDGRLVLWAHGQAAQVALASSCAREAAAIVLLSPVPRAIDAVLISGLHDRHQQSEAGAKAVSSPLEHTALLDKASALKNLAGTRAAGFASMKAGKFAKDARVDGATIAFWLGWISLTDKTSALLEPVKARVIVVVGSGDQQLSAADREAAQQLPAAAMVVVDADHYLLVDGALNDGVVQQISEAVDLVIGAPPS